MTEVRAEYKTKMDKDLSGWLIVHLTSGETCRVWAEDKQTAWREFQALAWRWQRRDCEILKLRTPGSRRDCKPRFREFRV